MYWARQFLGGILGRRQPRVGPQIAGPVDWSAILAKDAAQWKSARAHARQGPKVLIATSVGGYLPGTILESMLAVALTLRGAQAHLLLCDRLLPACLQAQLNLLPDENAFVEGGPQVHLCATCYEPARAVYESLSLRVHYFGDFATAADRQAAQQLAEHLPYAELFDYRSEGVPVGQHALAATLRYYARGDLDGEPHAEVVMRRYFNAALLSAIVSQRLFDTGAFTTAVVHHGIYVPQGLVVEAARRNNVHVVVGNPTYRKRCFIFSHNDTYHNTMLDEPVANWENMQWTPKMEGDILDYLQSRRFGSRDWISVADHTQKEDSEIASELGLDLSRPTIGMLTNVMWDAQLFYPGNAFSNMLEWVLETIQYFAARPDLQLVIRIHPAEIRSGNPSRQPLVAEIERAFPVLPANVRVIAPDSPISTYAVMLKCNAVLIYGTKTGLELASLGIPVVVAGEAWIRNKGLAMDAETREQYFGYLDRLPLPGRLPDEVTTRARKYAYHFFFRRMIPLGMMEPTAGWPPFRLRVNGLDELLPGRDRGLDVVCDGILNGGEFVYPAESYPDTIE